MYELLDINTLQNTCLDVVLEDIYIYIYSILTV